MTQKEQWRETLLKVILMVGASALTIFPIVYTFQGLYLYAIIEAVVGVVLWITLVRVRVKHNYPWQARIGWGGVMLVFTILLYTGGLARTGLIWWSLIPIMSFVLFEVRGGIKSVLFGYLVLGVVATLNYLNIAKIVFSYAEVIQSCAAIAVGALIMYFYEGISSQARNEAEYKASLLEEESIKKKSIENELIENLSKLQSEKESQANVRTAILNLLEDSKDLEKALQKEKAGVEKKVIERTLELSNTKAKLDSSIENLPLGFLMADIEEKLVVTNSLANSILEGKNEADNLKNLKTILKNKVDLEKYIKNCGEDKKRLVFTDIELNGRYFQFLLSPILTKEAEEVCIGVVILIQDITEAKILDRSKDEFFSIASHELRTPLTAIRGNTSMILEYYAEAIKDPELKAMVDDIHESSIRLINIVNDFLNVSRLEQSRMVFDTKEFKIEELVPETIKEYDVTGSRQKLSIDFIAPAAPLPPVMADPDKVRQVIINLLGNALKFTEKGGVKISTEFDDKFVKVLVTDTGRGISQKQQSLLFHKFQQAGSSLFTRDTAGGSGLGLYISKMMIEGMGGVVRLEKSEENVGSTFSFTIPIVTKGGKKKEEK